MGAEASTNKDNITNEVNQTNDRGEKTLSPDISEKMKRQREIQRMDQSVRERIHGGVQYNMKIVIRGERGSGKSTLLRRLQGYKFQSVYTATPEIQSATINWIFKNSDSVKVEAWDVIDKAIRNKLIDSQTAVYSASRGHNKVALLDSSIVDIYKNTHSALFLINPFSQTSLQYCRLMARDVPQDISVIFLLNFRDLIRDSKYNPKLTAEGKMIEVTRSEVIDLCNEIRYLRSKGNVYQETDVFALEVSLFNCYGLKELHKYLDIPFLKLKMKALRDQLSIAESELTSSTKELGESINSSDYLSFEAQYLIRKSNCDGQAANLSNDNGDNYSLTERDAIEIEATSSRTLIESTSNKLKLSHDIVVRSDTKTSIDSEKRDTNSKKKKSSKGRSQELETSSKSTHEQEIDSFSPLQEHGNDTLEGFLEPSDEEDKKLKANKDRIRACLKEKNSSSMSKEANSEHFSDSNESSDEEERALNKSNKTQLAKKSTELGKLKRAGKSSAAPTSPNIPITTRSDSTKKAKEETEVKRKSKSKSSSVPSKGKQSFSGGLKQAISDDEDDDDIPLYMTAEANGAKRANSDSDEDDDFPMATKLGSIMKKVSLKSKDGSVNVPSLK